MDQATIFPAADSPALRYAAAYLQKHSWQIADTPDSTVSHLLLPVPSLDAQGYIKGGASLPSLLQRFSDQVTVIGGNIDTVPLPRGQVIDLLKDNRYLAQNAAITAHCAIKVCLGSLERTLHGCPILVIGWGRIGKCLTRLLRGLDAQVAVAVRKESDYAMLAALGYDAVSIPQLSNEANRFPVIFNTAPHPVLNTADCAPDAVLIELASSPGLIGSGIIDARGLPGKEAPRSSGELIGKTILRLTQGKE